MNMDGLLTGRRSFPILMVALAVALLTLEFGHRGSGGGATRPAAEDSYATPPACPRW